MAARFIASLRPCIISPKRSAPHPLRFLRFLLFISRRSATARLHPRISASSAVQNPSAFSMLCTCQPRGHLFIPNNFRGTLILIETSHLYRCYILGVQCLSVPCLRSNRNLGEQRSMPPNHFPLGSATSLWEALNTHEKTSQPAAPQGLTAIHFAVAQPKNQKREALPQPVGPAR